MASPDRQQLPFTPRDIYGTSQRPLVRMTARGNHAEDAGKLIVRAILASVILMHGVSRLIGGLGAVEALLRNAGFPPQFATPHWSVKCSPRSCCCCNFTRASVRS